jgi:hypothetical protein
MIRIPVVLALLAATSVAEAQQTNGKALTPPPKAVAGTAVAVTRAQFNELRWLEGTWRGSGGGVPAFAEGYKVANDTTIDISFYADSTAAKVKATGKLYLSAGQLFYVGNGTEYVATMISPTSVTFVPKGTNGKNVFELTMSSPTEWTARLKGGTGEITPPVVTYTMSKIR